MDAEHTITNEIVIYIIVSVEDSCLEAGVCSISGDIYIIDSNEVL